ncbi:hypothetical protein C9I86_19455 [Photobacterium sp. NCIMB 13483]|uniref:hypothetical protein n=1 Tax=Photobacterium sp. NCIMB 13483 TaxID=2022103 RepID=UPI000D178D41|nr:hypothetical protein [Photobacterium sp. NCIMB 13483]PST85360.1 hypothetical protein C9I86_19455 [Photobacterium sp. NCIMB 13483]
MSTMTFNRKSMPVLPELRPMYKIAKVLIFLKLCSSGNKASLLKLHLFNWAYIDSNRVKALQLSVEKKELYVGVWGIDPALNMALGFALADQLIEKKANGMYQLTDKGDSFIKESDLINLFDSEIIEFKKIGKKITESMINNATRRWVNEI